MNSKKLLCSLILVWWLAKQTAAQLAQQWMHLPPSELEKSSKLHFAAWEGLQRHGNEISLVLVGEFASDMHLGIIGDHDVGGEVGFVLKDWEQSLFIAPKLEVFRVLWCKFFIKENIELIGESIHFVPGANLEVPLHLWSFHGHCFVSWLIDHSADKHWTAILLETGVTVEIK